MKFMAFISAATLFVATTPKGPSDFTVETSTIYRGDMRIDRIMDYNNNVVCYFGQHYDGSSHTTPAISCLKLK